MRCIYMKQYILSFLLILSLCAISQAQSAFWQQDFSNGIPANWANYDSVFTVVKWNWSDDPTAALASGQPHFSAASVANGFALFNSDVLNNITHDVRLETAAINCSNQSAVVLHFENQFAYFSNQSRALLGVSTDSLTWQYDTLFTNLAPNDVSSALQIVEIDISNQAANQPKVYLQFRWIGSDEFAWRLDDIRLQNILTPPAQHDLAIDIFAIPSNFATPLAHARPVELGALIVNNGLAAATNLKLQASVFDDVSQALMFTDDVTINNLNPNDSTILAIPTFYTPTTKGSFRLEYHISQDSTDQLPLDNHIISKFRITDTLFSKDANTGFVPAQPSGGGDYDIGNLYEMKSGGYYADKVIFSCGIEPGLGILNGRTVNFKLYEIDSTIDNFFLNFDVNSDNHVTEVGLASYTFSATDNNFDFFVTNIEDLNGGGSKVILKPNGRYFLMVSFTGAANQISIAVSDALSYDANYATILKYNNKWELNGFGPSFTAVVRMTITQATHTRQQQLSIGSVNVYPNPADEQFYLDIDLKDKISDLQIDIWNEMGQTIRSETKYNFQKERIKYATTDWASGVYFISIQSDFGKTTQRIVVH